MNDFNSKEETTKGAIAFMARNSVTANLLMAIFLLGGLLFMSQVTQEVFPEFTTDTVSIIVPYPGASPDEVEQGIILAIEDNVQGIQGVKKVTSSATEGSARVYVELLESANPEKLLQDIKNNVDRITSFPEESLSPEVSLVEARKRVVSLIVYGQDSPSAIRELGESAREDLISRGGITLVELGLTKPLEISIEIKSEILKKYNLTLEEVARKIKSTAFELPGGEIKTDAEQILIRTKDRRNYGKDFEDIVIKSNSTGTFLRLGEIATIKDGLEEKDIEAKFNGENAVLLEIYRVGNETPQSVSKAVSDYIEHIKPYLPKNTGMKIWDDRSITYKDRVSLLLKNAALGLILVLFLLGLFLEIKLAFWVTLGIPVSVIGCFLFFPLTGATINMISLFAFIISLGIIVDDAIVMGENIYEKRASGLNNVKAAIVGAKEVSMPIVFAVLTNIVAFLPLMFVPGTSGKFFKQIPAVVVAVFFISLIESIFILPAHLSHHKEAKGFLTIFDKPRAAFASFLNNFIHKQYSKLVNLSIKYRYLNLALAIFTLFIAFGVAVGGHLKLSFMPKIEADVVTAQVVLNVGTSLERSREIEKKIIKAAKEALEENGEKDISKGIYSQIGAGLVSFGPGPNSSGGQGGHVLATQVSLVSSDKRKISATELANIWRNKIAYISELDSLSFKSSTGASEGAPIDIQLSHSNTEILEKAASELAQKLKNYQGVFDIDDGVANGKKQISLKLSPEGKSLGLSADELARQVRASFYGSEAIKQQRGRNEIKVMVRLPEEERSNINTLNNLLIRTTQGGEIPLYRAAEISYGRSYTEIERRNSRRITSITADLDDKVTTSTRVLEDVVENEIPKLIKKYPGLSQQFGGEEEARQDSLKALGIGFIFSSLAIFALLAIPFNSYIQPLIVMISIPFGFIGAIIGHFMLGYGLSIISLFGLIALSGVVVNDSLVLVVTANRLVEEGLTREEAIKSAGKRRFRPIILTSLTTFFGLAPMIFETSLQARFLIPMAISLGFGILFATIIILSLVPSIYIILDDILKMSSRIFGKKEN